MGAGGSSSVKAIRGGTPIGTEIAVYPALHWPDGLDLSALRYLVAAAEAGKFSQAAKALGVRTSTVSRNVAKTEDALGVTLFERGHFGVRLTAAGRAVLVQVRRAIADLDAICLAGRSRGTGQIGEIHLAVGMPVGPAFGDRLKFWHNQNPQIEITLHDLNERESMLALMERRIDVAIVPRHGLCRQVTNELIGREPILVAMPKLHHLATAEPITWDDLRDETFLVQGWETSQSEQEFYASLLGGGMKCKVHPASKQTILALVGAEFGLTLVTKSQAQVQYPNVIYRPIAEANAQVDIALAWAPQNEEAVVGRFVAFMRDRKRSWGIL